MSAEGGQRDQEHEKTELSWLDLNAGNTVVPVAANGDDVALQETEDLNGQNGVGGGLGKRGEPGQRITSYIGVSSVDEYVTKVEKLGGKVIQSKMTVPGWGYLAICFDTEDNMFGLWQEDKNAK